MTIDHTALLVRLEVIHREGDQQMLSILKGSDEKTRKQWAHFIKDPETRALLFSNGEQPDCTAVVETKKNPAAEIKSIRSMTVSVDPIPVGDEPPAAHSDEIPSSNVDGCVR